MDPYQFGKIEKCYTVHVLIEMCHEWFKDTDDSRKNNYVNTVLINYSKAFGCINRNIRLHKLLQMDVPNFLLHWIMDLLLDQVQKVRLSESMSTPLDMWELYPKAPNYEFFFTDDQ